MDLGLNFKFSPPRKITLFGDNNETQWIFQQKVQVAALETPVFQRLFLNDDCCVNIIFYPPYSSSFHIAILI